MHISPCDITKNEEVQAMFKEAIDKFGTVDALINSVGVIHPGRIDEIEASDWWLDYVRIPYPL